MPIAVGFHVFLRPYVPYGIYRPSECREEMRFFLAESYSSSRSGFSFPLLVPNGAAAMGYKGISLPFHITEIERNRTDQ